MAADNDDRVTDIRGDVRAEIREFLSTRRAKISPAQAGLPAYGGDRRRVSGLRREEVALLAGISSEYYTRLERGNATGVSDSVIDGIAHALHLDDAERTHLLDLLRSAGTTRPPRRRPARQRVRPTVQRVLDSMVGTPGFVLNGRLDLLAANQLGFALFSSIYADPARPPNTARFLFLDPQATEFFGDWDKVANDTVALLRAEAGRDPYDRQLSDLNRGAVDPQRRIPGPMGRPPRPDPYHRHQALPPPGRRRPGAGLRVLPAGCRSQPEPPHLHRRTGIALPGRPAPAGQLGRDHRRHRTARGHRRLGAG
jgi:transcriptional regulator with XRE-family HTH domain